MSRFLWPLCIVLVALLAGLVLSRPNRGVVTYFYDEQDRVVGARGWDCELRRVQWGEATASNRSVHVCDPHARAD